MKIFFKLRGWLMVPPLLLACLCRTGEVENYWLVLGVGGSLFGLGLFLRVWAQQHLHYRLKTQKILTETGPYAYVRNPIYIGNTLLFCAVCVLAELFWLAPLMAVYSFLVYSLTVHYEERRLTEKYGEPYREFMRRVPRWLPNFRVLARRIDVSEYLRPSLRAEAHNLLLLLPVIIKELLDSN